MLLLFFNGFSLAHENIHSSTRVTRDEQKIIELENKLYKIEQKLNLHTERNVQNQDQEIERTELSEGPFSYSSDNGENRLDFHGTIQTDQDIFMQTRGLTINDGINSEPIINSDTVDRLWLRSANPTISGRLMKYTDFFIITDFGQGQIRLFDAFVNLHYFDELQLNIGKQMSLLVGLDNIKPTRNTFSMENSFPSVLAPNRQIGFVFHGTIFKQKESSDNYVDDYDFLTSGVIAYQFGVFSGTADDTNPGLNPVNTTDFSTETSTLQNKSFEFRAFLHPFKQSSMKYLADLGLGLAYGMDNPDNNTFLPSMISVGQNVIFSYVETVAANGGRQRLHPQGYWFYGPYGIVTEWTRTSQSLSSSLEPIGPNVINKYTHQDNTAGQVQVIYNITGEKLAFQSYVHPNRVFKPFDLVNWGALQLVGRFTWLNMDNNIFASSEIIDNQRIYTFADPRISVENARTWSVGLNWILNKYVKLTTEYDQTSFHGGCSTGAMSAPFHPGCLTSGEAALAVDSLTTNRPNEKVVMQRVQLCF